MGRSKVLEQALPIRSDDEGRLTSKKLLGFFKGEGVTHKNNINTRKSGGEDGEDSKKDDC